MLSFNEIREYLEKGIDPHSLSPMVIVKTIIENGITEKTNLDYITKEIEFYNKDNNSESKPAIREAVDVLIKNKIIEEDPKNEFTLNVMVNSLNIADQLELISLCNKKIYFRVNAHYEPVKINPDYYLASGPGKNWVATLDELPMRWGKDVRINQTKVEDKRETEAKTRFNKSFDELTDTEKSAVDDASRQKIENILLSTWNQMNEGGVVFFRADDPVNKCFGLGIIKKKYVADNKKTDLYYPEEKSKGELIWTHRIDIDPILCSFEIKNDELYVEEAILEFVRAIENTPVQRSFFHFNRSDSVKELIAQMKKCRIALPSKEDLENMHFKDLIAAYDKDRYLFGPSRMSSDDITNLCADIKKNIFEKIDKLTLAGYATGEDAQRNRISGTFCAELERIFQDLAKFPASDFGVYQRFDKASKHEMYISRSSVYPDENAALKQLQADLQQSTDLVKMPIPDISNEMRDGCFKIPIFYASLFVLKPDQFLPIPYDTKMGNALTAFGIPFDDNASLILKQQLLLDAKNNNDIMRDWSPYDFAFFAIQVSEIVKNRTNYVLCRFMKSSGTLPDSFTFSNAETSHEEIQANSRLVFFDIIDDEIKWWGEAKAEEVIRKIFPAKHEVKLQNFAPFGKIQDISTMNQATASLNEELGNELSRTFDFTNDSIIPVDYETYKEIIDDFDKQADFVDENLSLPASTDIRQSKKIIQENLLIDDEVIDRIIAALYSGKSVLLTGPIGCGKTELAKKIPETVWRLEQGGYYAQITTATSDWTTQDVIGGIVPKVVESEKVGDDGKRITEKNVQFLVQKGVASKAASENWHPSGNGKRTYVRKEGDSYRGVWLVIDEFNRADVDKAFGSLFTALEYRKDPGIKIPTSKDGVEFDTIVVPKDFRIIGTLNTKDINYLFPMSDALKRRFEIIEINPPTYKDSEKEINIVAKKVLKQLDDASFNDLATAKDLTKDTTELNDYLKFAYEILAFIRIYHSLGTAVLIAVVKFLTVFHAMEEEPGDKYDLQDCLDIALCNSILPQIEKLPAIKLGSIKNFLNNFKDKDGKSTMNDTFDVEYWEDFESKKRIEELVNLIKFANEHNAGLDVEKWKKHFTNTTKEDRQNDPGRASYELNQLEPWKWIFAYKKTKIKEKPNLKRFEAALEKIMSAKGFQAE